MNIVVSAYLDNNIGDDLMIKMLAERFFNHTFIIYTNKSVVKSTFKDYGNIDIRKLEFFKEDLKNIDVHLSIGGSIFNNINSFKGYCYRLKRILFLLGLKLKNIKIATIGCNLGPYNNKIGPFLTKLELTLNDLVTVRDSNSYNQVKKMSKRINCWLDKDIVYSFNWNSKIKKGNENVLGISAYRSQKPHDRNYYNYKSLAEIGDKFIEKTGGIVKLFAFDSENENDISAAHHIKNNSIFKEKFEIIPYLGDEITFISQMEYCSTFIAIRFHSAILSHKLKIPYLPIIYSNKMEFLLNDNNYSGIKYQLNELDENIDIETIVNNLIEKNRLFDDFHMKSNDNFTCVHFEKFGELIDSI